MGPIAYALCQQPIIGVAMLVTSLCSFPPLFHDQPIDLTTAGATLSTTFSAPVDKPYFFDLSFAFPSAASLKGADIVGWRDDVHCMANLPYDTIPEAQRTGLGRPIPLHVTIRRTSDHVIVVDRTFVSLCRSGTGAGMVADRTVGRVDLPRGDYVVAVTNLAAQAGLAGVKTSLALVAGHGK